MSAVPYMSGFLFRFVVFLYWILNGWYYSLQFLAYSFDYIWFTIKEGLEGTQFKIRTVFELIRFHPKVQTSFFIAIK